MRAGAFCDKRVIDLLNRRFVSYFFNRSGHGRGGSAAASAFTVGKTKNPYAYYAAFKADGTYLGETPLYGTKDDVFAFLRKLLVDHPEFAHATAAEKAEPDQARVAEELGDWDRADALYAKADTQDALRGRVRIARYRKDWTAHAELEKKLTAPADIAMERSYRLLAAEKYADVQVLLRAALKRLPVGVRTAEMHFYCGVACWFRGERDWAKFHWCWVQDNLPDDRMYMRCRVASAAENMPYANPELGGFKSGGMIGTGHIVAEVARSMRIYRAYRPKWEAGDFSSGGTDDAEDDAIVEDEAAAAPTKSVLLLVASLRDGNAHRLANNKVVAELETIGKPAIAILTNAVNDVKFPGRGYAAWALARVLKATGERPKSALDALRAATQADDGYVKALSSSGLRQLR